MTRIWLLITCCFCNSVIAQDLEKQRELFLQTEHEAKHGKRAVYKRLQKELGDYPLAPYAHSTYLQKRISYRNRDYIKAFLDKYPEAPFSVPLRKKWLHFLADRRYKNTFVEHYQDIGDAKLACLNLRWRKQQGADVRPILEQVTPLWLAPKSQPRECDPLFRQWISSGYLTSDVALERLKLAAQKRNWGLIPYLATLIDDKDKHLASLWKSVVRRPHKIHNQNFFLFHNDKEKEVFIYGIHRQIFRDPQKVAKLWQQKSEKFQFNKVEQQYFEKRLALSFAVANHDKGLDYLQQLPDEAVDESIKQWRLAYTLDDMDWQQTLNVISNLPEQMQTDISVVYWKARALEGLGQEKWANDTFKELAERRDYYGFLAANKVGAQVQLRHEPLQIDYPELLRVGKHPNLRRAFELFKISRMNDARREWNLLLEDLTDQEKLVAAKLAYDWGWYDRPIFLLAEVGHLNDVNMRFPLAFKNILSNTAKNKNIDPALLFAITRRESSFMPDAYSHAGAAGLMQIKPSTASYIAKRKVRRNQLFEPKKNVDLAANYWTYLMKQTKGNPVLTTAAYNAGFGKVKKWLPESSMPADAWIETIPYKETRNYVKAVVAYSKVYEKLLSQQEGTFKDISNIEIAPSL